MIDTYKMILWARPTEESIDKQAEQLFSILMALNQIEYLKPKYQTVRRKKDAIEFDLTLENVKRLITNKRDKQFPDLGSSISFFTSLKDNESACISISIGVSNLKFINNIVIDLNWDYKKMELKKFEELEGLFKTLIIQFKPFYGCIASKSCRDNYDEYYDDINCKPKAFFDMNFWGHEIMKNLKMDNEVLSKVYEYDEVSDGYYIRILKEPFNTLDSKHMELQQEVSRLIGI